MNWLSGAMEMLIPIIAIIASFTFLGVIIWAKHRRTERETYYRHELIKQMAEKADSDKQLLEFMREENRVRQQNRRQGLMVGGLITLAIGIGYMLGFQWLGDQIWAIGVIPALIGVAMLLSGYLFGTTSKDKI